MMRSDWRSLLFVPANAPQRWTKAHTRGADAIIIDLEDSTQPGAKVAARAHAHDAVRFLAQHGAPVTVRVNNHPDLLEVDLAAVLQRGLSAIILPKVEQAEELAGLDRLLTEFERRAGLSGGSVRVIAVIESPAALERATRIADGPRLIGLALGSEDFALALGRPPAPACLDLACQTVAYAAAARDIMGIGMACGIGDFSNLAAWRHEAERAHAMGLSGAMAIHPTQIAPLNEAFAPDPQAVAEARAILAAWDKRDSDVVAFNGRMLDQPVVERARRLLAALGE